MGDVHDIMYGLNSLSAHAHKTAKEKGWWDKDEFNVPEKLALIHSEVSEALEDYRMNRMETTQADPGAKPEGFPSELADIVIRVGDLCERMGIDLGVEVLKKLRYNQTREWRHGGKRA